MMKAPMPRAVLRVLRFLHGGSATVRPGASGRHLLEVPDRGTIATDDETMRELVHRGLVATHAGVLSITADGRALVARREGPTEDFAAQHQERARSTVKAGGAAEQVMLNLSESPLGALARRRNRDGSPFLAPRQIMAGELMPRTGVDWSSFGMAAGGGGRQNGIAELSDTALGARRRVEAAIEAVGPELAGVLVDVCCFLKGLELVEAEREWPVRSAKVLLRAALEALARHYQPGDDRPARRDILHWGADGYRPRMGAGA
jgi:hypothetical protein